MHPRLSFARWRVMTPDQLETWQHLNDKVLQLYVEIALGVDDSHHRYHQLAALVGTQPSEHLTNTMIKQLQQYAERAGCHVAIRA